VDQTEIAVFASLIELHREFLVAVEWRFEGLPAVAADDGGRNLIQTTFRAFGAKVKLSIGTVVSEPWLTAPASGVANGAPKVKQPSIMQAAAGVERRIGRILCSQRLVDDGETRFAGNRVDRRNAK
jgi:hypothetical protein